MTETHGKSWRSAEKFACHGCGGQQSLVERGEPVDGGYRRVRKCRTCGARFQTVERIERALPKTKAA
jgi:transcriptional regulator NrdR family protein